MRRWIASFTILGVLVLAVVGILVWRATRPIIGGGYTEFTSYSPGDMQRVYLVVTRPEERTTVRLYDITGRVIDSVRADLTPQLTGNPEPWRQGFGLRPAFRYAIPDLKSGVYLWEREAPFVVRSRNASPDVVVVYPANTVAAYNRDGGRGLYGPNRPHRLGIALEHLLSFRWGELSPGQFENRSGAVSFQRTGNRTQWELFEPFLRWAQTGLRQYDIAYISDPDLDDYENIADARLLIIIGHSEYWTRRARQNFDRFVRSGKPALVLSGNTMWWQVRYNPDRTQVICYKDGSLDPVQDTRLQTVNWSDPSLNYPIWQSIGVQYPLGGYGQRKPDGGWDGYKIVSPRSPLLEGVSLGADSIISVPTLEYDGAWLAQTSSGVRLDTTKLAAYRTELVGYDLASHNGTAPSQGTFIVYQPTRSAGVVVNVGSTNWCSTTGIDGRDSTAVRRITANAIRLLVSGQSVFSGDQ